MKTILFLFILFLSVIAFGQIKPVKPLEHKIEHNWTKKQYERALNDTIPDIFTKRKSTGRLLPLIYLNNICVEHVALKTINPEIIKKIWIEKDSIIFNGNKYYGKIFVTTKTAYKPALITLNELKKKHTPTQKQTIFTIDSEVIEGDYDKIQVDEKYLLSINIVDICVPKEKLDISIIKINTRSKENIEKLKKIRIRGKDTAEKLFPNYPNINE